MKNVSFDVLGRRIHTEKAPNLLKTPHELYELSELNGTHIMYSGMLSRLFFFDSDEFKSLKEKEKNIFSSGNFLAKAINSCQKKREQNNRVAFQITTKCNLQCRYCYAAPGIFKEKNIIDFDFVKKYMDSLKPRPTPFHLFFFGGGEPFLAIDIIKKIVNYIKKDSPIIFMGGQTNGVVPKKTLEWMAKNLDYIKLSCDGPPDIQNKQRPLGDGSDSSRFVEKSIAFLLKRNKELEIHSTITEYSVKKQGKIIEYFYTLGIKKIVFNIASDEFGRAKGNLNPYGKRPDFKLYGEYFLKANELAEEYGIKLSTMHIPLQESRTSLCDLTVANLTEDGFVTGCHRISSGCKGPDEFVYGTYNQKKDKLEINKRKRDILKNRQVCNIKECQNCFLKWNCAGFCTLSGFYNTGNLFKPDKNSCNEIRKLTKKYLLYLVQKHFTKLFPRMEKKEHGLFLSFFYFKKKVYLNRMIMLDDLENKTKNALSNQHITDNQIVLFSHSFNEINKDELFDTLKKLQEKKIHFRITKPLPKCMTDIDRQRFQEHFRAPKNCDDCMELFTVHENGDILFCNGLKGKKKISEYRKRTEIQTEFKERAKISEKCTECIQKTRGMCCGLPCAK